MGHDGGSSLPTLPYGCRICTHWQILPPHMDLAMAPTSATEDVREGYH